MYNIEEIFDEIDQIDNIKVLKRIEKQIKESSLTDDFWAQRKIARKSSKALDSQRAKLKCQVIAKKFGAAIPISKDIKKFRAPYGFYGIQIGKYVQIGKGCTIFPNVVIGENTFVDSKNAGFPSIGENVFIGAGAIIIGNVTIGDNARIGANAIVTKDVPANSVVVAVEPRIILKDEMMDNTFLSAKKYREMLQNQLTEDVDDVDDIDDFDDDADDIDDIDETEAPDSTDK